MDRILQLLEDDCRLSAEQLAVMCGRTVEDVKSSIAKLEAEGVILGYKALIDWDKTDREYVTALIEVKITPQRDRGFDRVAERIYNFPEVQNLYLAKTHLVFLPLNIFHILLILSFNPPCSLFIP